MEKFYADKRYHTLDYFFKEKFGRKVAKIPLSGGFTCPNRDGTKGTGGCIYCSANLSGEFAGDAHDSIPVQYAKITEMMSKKWKNTAYMPYFQTGTGTYAPAEKLERPYYEALSLPGAVGLSIATRPDCIDKDVLKLLSDISKKTYLTVELGLQSVHDSTGEIINRKSSFSEFENTFGSLKELGIDVCVHLINGLPGETREMMMQSVKTVSDMRPWSLKLHLLHVIRGTVCEKMYREGRFDVFAKEDYVDLICDQLEIIHPDIVMQRLTGDGERSELVAPLWSIRKFEVLNSIDAEMKRRNAFQGDKCP